MRKRILLWIAAAVLFCTLLPQTMAAERTKLVALTFDDGPGPYTEQLLNGLQKRGIQASFFVQGCKAEKQPELINRMIVEGHQLCNHSYDHPDLALLPLEDAMRQLHETDAILNSITGGTGAYHYRAPYGSSTAGIREQLQAPIYYWTVDCQDWVDKSADAITEQLLNNIYDGTIVLIHDTVAGSVEASLSVVDVLRDEGYEFVTLKELFRRRGVSLTNGSQYYSCLPTGVLLDELQVPDIEAVGTQEALTVTLSSYDGAPIYYSVDGSALSFDAKRYTGPFTVELPCTIRAVAALDLNGGRSQELRVTYRQPPADRPDVMAENGKVRISLGDVGTDLYYRHGGEKLSSVIYDAGDLSVVAVTPDSWLYCYADGPDCDASPVTAVWYSARGNLFADADPEAWYFEDLDRAAALGYVSDPEGDHMFRPNAVLTRGILADMMYRFSGDRVYVLKAVFEDVPADHPFAAAISWACREKLMSEERDGIFEPDTPVTRQEMAKVLAGFLGEDAKRTSLQYRDNHLISAWAKDGVRVVTALDLMHGANGYFNPWGTLSKAEALTILMRLHDYLN